MKAPLMQTPSHPDALVGVNAQSPKPWFVSSQTNSNGSKALTPWFVSSQTNSNGSNALVSVFKNK